MRGLANTLIISFFTIFFSFIFGSILGIARFYNKGIITRIATMYVDTVRNIPLLLFILSCYFLLHVPPVVSVIIAMTIFTSAMIAEIVRGGLNSVPAGQWEAAYSQGFTFVGTLIHIVMPQAVKKILYPLVGQFVTAIKDTSFCQVIAVKELMYSGMIIMGKFITSTQVIAMYAFIALIYFVLTTVLLRVSQRIKF
jgi:putative glutamine transport system permease protein